jgi:hypothetical protein
VKAGDAWAGCITEVRAIRAPAPAGIDAGQDPSAWADLLSGFAA